MAEMVGGAFLTVVFQKLFEQLASPELRNNSVASKRKMLERKLKRVQLYLDYAEDKQLFDKKVKEWLDELKHVVFMAVDLVEEIYDSKKLKKSKRRLVTRAIKSVYHSLAKTVQGEIDLILTELDALLDQSHVQGSVDAKSSRPSPPIITPLREERHVFGRETDKEEIWKSLLLEEDKIVVIPIVGMGGLGKTTLAQLVYNDKRVEDNDFILKAWVSVSTEFNFCRIIKELLKKVNPEKSTSDINDPNELQQLMKEAVRDKKFLFVLDDVWEENYDSWDPLISNFAAGDPRSRVIVTTRSRVVGTRVTTRPMYELKEVRDDDCWRIFIHHAFNGDTNNVDPQLKEIGKRIVAKCKGLPLAVKSIGGHLRSERNPEKWENIRRSHVWDWSTEQKGNVVLLSLWLSYRDLSSTLKQCFAYCSLFPQDYKFKKKQMVLLWMAEGFLPPDKRMEEVGEQWFDDLVSRSLFQRSSEDENMFVMHDLVHDLAAFVYGQFCFRMGDDLKNVTIRTRHLPSYDSYEKDNDLLTGLSRAKYLRTFLHFHSLPEMGKDFVAKVATKMRFLRVLTLSQSAYGRITRLPEMGGLVKLRYLDLSENEIEVLPDSICTLFHLQTLILWYCDKLTRLPTEMRKLTKLRHLDTEFTRFQKMPPNMGKLKELRILTEFVLGEDEGSGCSSLKELGKLHHLGILGISKLQNVRNLKDIQNANILMDKVEIKQLKLEWDGDHEAAAGVLEALRPHPNLERLEVYLFSGSSFPKWVGDDSFSKMVFMRLKGKGSLCHFLPQLGKLPSLRELYIEDFEGVEIIGNEFLYGDDNNSSITPFLSLESLSFKDMSSWKECSFVGNESRCFPHLKNLFLTRCPKLESTKHQHLASLRSLHIYECPLLETRYMRNKGDDWHYISDIPNITIRGKTTDELERE